LQSPRAEAQDEAELIRRSRGGDTEAFGVLVESYQRRIFATVYRILGNSEDAREMAQEAFLRAWSKLDSFREGARFSTWLYTIALNLTRSELRKRKVRRDVKPVSLDAVRSGDDGPRPDPEDPEDPPDAAVERSEVYERARREIEALDPASREVVVLRDMQSLSYEEIAEALGVPIGTVRSRLHRARETLRERLSPLVSGRRGEGAA
jgi:RNA polymerase sigma-70 factor (ECF subfamily)